MQRPSLSLARGAHRGHPTTAARATSRRDSRTPRVGGRGQHPDLGMIVRTPITSTAGRNCGRTQRAWTRSMAIPRPRGLHERPERERTPAASRCRREDRVGSRGSPLAAYSQIAGPRGLWGATLARLAYAPPLVALRLSRGQQVAGTYRALKQRAEARKNVDTSGLYASRRDWRSHARSRREGDD
jgi:hypothetical protein